MCQPTKLNRLVGSCFEIYKTRTKYFQDRYMNMGVYSGIADLLHTILNLMDVILQQEL